MSCFVDAMDIATTSTAVPQPLPAPAGKQLGENGSPEYTADGVGDHLVALFFAIVRGMSCKRLNEMLDSLLAANSHQQDAQTQAPQDQAQAQAHAEANVVADAMLLAFQTRNCRGGKGERDLFYWMIIYLYKLYPQTTTELLHLIPHYGSYKDWFRIVALTEQTDLKDAILTLAAQQLLKDQECLLPSSNGNGNGNGCSPSLLAKWAPREKGSVHAKQQASALAKKLYPTSTTANCQYRQLISSLNKALNTIEVKMCANEWSTIDFSAVPSVAMLKYRKAFLNESVRTVPTSAEEETGNRHPENEERIACRKRLRHTLLEDAVSKLNGKQLFPHEIVAKIMNGNISSLEADLMQQQWNAIRDDVKLALSTSTSTSTAATDGTSDRSGKKVDLGKLVAVGDVSGSMYGTPMVVSIALSILVSELSAPEFAGRFLTFSEDPSWFNFAPGMSLKDKVRAAARAPWGGSTNFEKCMDLILETAVAAKLAPSDIPDLIVFSDMQFNQARHSSHAHSWETQHELLVRKYKVAGLKACGEPWKPPHIIFWNLRGNTTGFPATADTEGVTMLSGFSPSLLKLLLSGEDLEQGEEIIEEVINADGEVVLTKTKVSRRPIDVVRSALDDSQYDKVRAILGRSKEGLLAGYEFEPPSSEEAEGDWVM